jgi:hypothetical protein
MTLWRLADWIFIVFFVVNLSFITYIVDIEQLTIANDPRNGFEDPYWPPKVFVNLIHWWGNNFDYLQLARPPFWKVTMFVFDLRRNLFIFLDGLMFCFLDPSIFMEFMHFLKKRKLFEQ